MGLNRGQWIGFIIIFLCVGMIVYRILQADAVVAFYTPEEVYKNKEEFQKKDFRVSGIVSDVKKEFQENRLRVHFRLSDGSNHDFIVQYVGLPPDLFQENQGVIVEGRLGPEPTPTIQASKLIVKHSEVYDTEFDHQELKKKKLMDSMDLTTHRGK
jgi:cytochrome c-type biogenesis protein CcmE